MIIKIIVLIVLVIANIPCVSCAGQSAYLPEYTDKPTEKRQSYVFGIHPQHNLKRIFEIYGPMVDYINGELINDNIELALEASREYAAFENKLATGGYHFALPNPYQTIKALEQGYSVFGKMDNDEEFRGIILVRRDSSIQNPDDLRGKAISYPAPTALAGTLLPQMYLVEHGLNVMHQSKCIYVGTHDASFLSVAMGQAEAGAGSAARWGRFQRDWPDQAREIYPIWTTEALPSNALVVHRDVPQRVLDKVANVILTMQDSVKGRAVLAGIPLSRFVSADSSVYKPIVDFVDKFEKSVRRISD